MKNVSLEPTFFPSFLFFFSSFPFFSLKPNIYRVNHSKSPLHKCHRSQICVILSIYSCNIQGKCVENHVMNLAYIINHNVKCVPSCHIFLLFCFSRMFKNIFRRKRNYTNTGPSSSPPSEQKPNVHFKQELEN